MDERDRWSELCERILCPGLVERYDTIQNSYSARNRRYHTMVHVHECLAVLDTVEHLTHRFDEVEFALWIHDLVYSTRRSDNEARSADLAQKWLEESGADRSTVDRIRGLILATRHDAGLSEPDEALIRDIDLNVLAASPERYDEYEAQIRKEYWWVPASLFRRRRVELLDSFLSRDRIFNTDWFRDRWEEVARANLERAVASLDGRAF